MNDADVIVIGSGHNGLSSALVLASAGLKVLVLERGAVPGGAAKTAELTLPGLKHDLYATNIGLFMGSPLYREFGRQLHEEGLDVVVSDNPFASAFPDGDAVRVTTNAEQTRAEFARQSDADAKAWDELLQYFGEVSADLLPVLQMPMPSWEVARHLFRTYRRMGRQKSLELLQLILKTPRQFAEHWFESDKIRSLFIPWGFHLDYGPDVAGGAMFPFIEVPMDHMNGMALAKGGVQGLIRSMVSLLERMNGTVVVQQEVSRVLIRQGRAVGVETTDGRQYYAKRGVVANVTPNQLVQKLIPVEQLPSQYVDRSRRFRFGPGTMMVHVALNGTLDWIAGEDLSNFCYVHIGPYVEDVAQAYTDALNGVLPASPLLVVGQQSVVDPSRSADGKHALWVQVRAVPSHPKRDSRGETKPTDWDGMKEQYADRVIDKIASYAPNVKQITVDRKVLSPADLEADNPNLIGGDSVSGSHHLDQNYVFRPLPGWSRYRTPISGLYLCGASTWPGGGLNATSGYLLGKHLLKKSR